MPKRFTRKNPKYQKNKQYIDISERYNRILNRVDIEKDAIYYKDMPIRNGLYYFHLIANRLFGNLTNNSYKDTLEYITNALSSYESSDSNEITIDTYDDKIPYDFIPNIIQYGVQDAGMSPKSYLSTIQNLITPGSYIDTCLRSSKGIEFGFGNIYDNLIFKKIGMPMIKSLIVSNIVKDSYNFGDCSIKLSINNSVINTTFNGKFIAYQGDVNYFKGNETKNKYFNNGTVDYETSVNYILCKELGDTLQVLFGKLFTDNIVHDNKKVCIFTNDSILTLRCKLVGMQVVFNIPHGKSSKTVYHYPVMSEIISDFLKLWQSNTIKYNEMNIKDIESVIKNKFYFSVSGKRITFSHNDNVYILLNKYINYIIQKNNEFKNIDYTTISSKLYHNYSVIYKVPCLFINDVLNNAILKLAFSYDEQNILLGGDSMTGGGDRDGQQITPFTFIYDDDEHFDYTKDHIYDDTVRPAVRTKRTLFIIFTKKYPEKSKNEICYIIEGISIVLASYFNFMGESTNHEEFLQKIVDQYEASTLGTQSFEDFESEYKEWAYKDDKKELEKIRNNVAKTKTYINSLNFTTQISVYGGAIKRKTRKLKHKKK